MALDLREPAPQPIRTANQVPLDLVLQHKQGVAFSSSATEMLYGGAAFGGKSHLMRVAAISWCTEIPGLQVYVFRRVEDDLLKNHMEGPHSFRVLLAPWVAAGLVKITELTIHFLFNGSKIHLCHCKDENHRFKYHGAEIHVLLMDELTTFTEKIYTYLRFRVRMVGVKRFDKDEQIGDVLYRKGEYRPTYPKKYRKGEIGPDGVTVNQHDVFPRILCGSNPGNLGHHWVKREFIDPVPPLVTWETADEQGGMMRQYIPARVADNAIGVAEDPDYVKRMRGLGDPALVKAMEEGDWNVIAGGFFPEFSKSRHVTETFDPPKHWKRFRSYDWGSARPFSVGWWAIAQEEHRCKSSIGSPITIQRGSIVRYREWYGCAKGKTNIGIDLPPKALANGVLHRSKHDPDVEYDVCDPAMFIEDGGPSIAEEMMSLKLGDRYLYLRPADNKRIPGWTQVRYRLQGDDPENGITTPTIFIQEHCTDSIRTMEGLQRDEVDIEDADSEGEDHAPDEIRYACMSRPRRTPDKRDRNEGKPKEGSYEWLVTEAWKDRRIPGLDKRPLE